jgi:hypothetical protein
MPKHPRDIIRARPTMLLWRNKEASELVIRELAPVVAPIIWLAARILEAETGATVPRGVVPSNWPGTREE